MRHAPQAIARVVFPSGRTERARVRGKRVIPAGVAYVVDKILEGNTRYGTAAAMPNYYAGVAAGKTGTTSNLDDAWFCGFDPKLATAIWMGYPQAEIAMPGVQGATYCVPIWGTYYELVFGARPIADFAVPAVLPHWRPWHGHYASLPPSPTPTATPTGKPTPSPPGKTAGSQPTAQPKPTATRSTAPSPTGQPTAP